MTTANTEQQLGRNSFEKVHENSYFVSLLQKQRTICQAGLGIRSIDFQANRLFFIKKWGNERFAQKMSDSLIPSFLLSNLGNSLTITHFLWATWANRSCSLIFDEWNERSAHIAHLIWVKWAIHSDRSPKKGNERFAHFFKKKILK